MLYPLSYEGKADERTSAWLRGHAGEPAVQRVERRAGGGVDRARAGRQAVVASS